MSTFGRGTTIENSHFLYLRVSNYIMRRIRTEKPRLSMSISYKVYGSSTMARMFSSSLSPRDYSKG
jgi:hypothetical protein